MARRGLESADLLLARRLYARRVALDLSQKQLAELMGVSFQQIQKYEQGKNKLTFGKLLRLAQCLNITVMALIDGLEPKSGNEDAVVFPAFMTDPQAVKVAEIFTQIRNRAMRSSILSGMAVIRDIDSRAPYDDEDFHPRAHSRRP